VSLKVNPRWGQGRSLGFIDKHDREWSHRLTTAVGPTIYFGSRCDSRGAFRTPPMTDIRWRRAVKLGVKCPRCGRDGGWEPRLDNEGNRDGYYCRYVECEGVVLEDLFRDVHDAYLNHFTLAVFAVYPEP